MIQAIIFDADDVVIQAESSSHQIAREMNIPISELKDFFDTDFQACVLGRQDLKTVIQPYLSKWNWTKSVDELINYWFTSEDKPNQALIKVIKQLKSKNIRCYLATNQEKYRAQYLADNMKFLRLFDYLFFSYEMHCKKPQTNFFTYIWDALNFMESFNDKTKIMFWDDKLENVQAAELFGFDAHQFSSNQQFRDTLERYDIII
jgi:putative hydrolase of the HAD superfamily